MPLNVYSRGSLNLSKGLKVYHILNGWDRFDALTLRKRQVYADMLFVFKCLPNLTGCTLSDVGLSITKSNTQGNDIRLEQCTKSGTRFSQRVLSIWNQHPLFIVSSANISALILKVTYLNTYFPLKHFNFLFVMCMLAGDNWHPI